MKLSSIDKCFQIIELLSENPQGLKLSEISGMLNFSPSTTHHILRTLYPLAYVFQDPDTRKYSPGFRFLEISSRIIDNIGIRKIAAKHLQELHKQCREAVHLAVLRNGKLIYVDKVDSPEGLSLDNYIGFSTDPHAAAGGKVLLADMPPAQVLEIYQGRPLKQYGKKTIISFGQLLKELEEVRKHGYAIEDEEYCEGMRGVAAPVKAGGTVVAAISIRGSASTFTIERMHEELIRLITKTAENISSEMFGK